MTDRQRVEAIFFLLLFKSVVESSRVDEAASEGNKKCVSYLDEGLWDVVKRAGADQKQRTLYRRAERLHNAVMRPHREGGIRLDKAAAVGFYLLQAVLREGYLELEEGGKTAVAIQAVVDEVGYVFSEEKLDASARKQARQMLSHLQDEGYYEGVSMEVEQCLS
jgi:hypothetical protein